MRFLINKLNFLKKKNKYKEDGLTYIESYGQYLYINLKSLFEHSKETFDDNLIFNNYNVGELNIENFEKLYKEIRYLTKKYGFPLKLRLKYQNDYINHYKPQGSKLFIMVINKDDSISIDVYLGNIFLTAYRFPMGVNDNGILYENLDEVLKWIFKKFYIEEEFEEEEEEEEDEEPDNEEPDWD